MEEVLGRLRRLVNLEINNHNYTIKGFAVRCEISYTEMREIVNGQTSDIKLSTICQICNNSNISFADVFVENESDLQRMINKVTILFENTDRYSVKLLRYR